MGVKCAVTVMKNRIVFQNEAAHEIILTYERRDKWGMEELCHK
jgi:hypothetical protein